MRIVFCLFLLVLTSCAAKQSVPIQPFVDSSKQYLDTSDVLLQQAKKSAFASSDAVVSLNRRHLNGSTANRLIQTQNKEVANYYELVHQLRRQRSLLYSYFSTLSQLSDDNEKGFVSKNMDYLGHKLDWLWPKGEEDHVSEPIRERKSVNLPQEIADNLVLVNRQIEILEINGQRIESLMEHTPAILVARLDNAVLENELRQRETMIRYSLSLHRAALQAISMKMNHELDTLAAQKEILRKKIEQQVENPYKNGNRRLSHCWSANRQMLLEEFAGIESTRRDAAKASSLAEEGAHHMQRAFHAFLLGERDLYELPMMELKTQELSALLASTQEPMLRALPKGCQNTFMSIEQVQGIKIVKPVAKVVIKKPATMKEKALLNKELSNQLGDDNKQKEYTKKSMLNWSSSTSYGPIVKGDTMFSIAKKLRVDARYSIAQIMAALLKKNKQAFKNNKLGMLKLGATLNVPTSKEVESLSSSQARAFVSQH
ncbi:MAG: FimV/HubP family polar landmark protein [Mariprofundaceae bacterium]|nr:FimV/HubP family polar landmark protein [Mariprofundaceae bacterium]